MSPTTGAEREAALDEFANLLADLALDMALEKQQAGNDLRAHSIRHVSPGSGR
jgi:hypothetical protein